MSDEKKGNKKWMHTRHKVVTRIAYAVLYPYSRLKYGIKIDKFKEQGNRQYLIVMNHQTAFDQFFVGMAFKGAIYYVASEDIFSLGFISKVLEYVVAPIPIKKQTTDVRAVMNCIKVAREGGTIALAPEGNRTYSGKTEYIKPAIAKLVRALKLPLAFFRIEGGYGVHPRWSDVVRKGKMHGYVSKVVEPEDYMQLSDDELTELINKELYVDEGCVTGTFKHKKKAEYLERAMYVCPKCGLSEFESSGDVIACKKCGLAARYLDTKELEGVDGEFPFRFVTEWYKYQCDTVNALDLSEYTEQPLYKEKISFSEVILYKKKQLILKEAEIALYGDRVIVRGGKRERYIFGFDKAMAFTVLGKNKLNIYYGDKVYQVRGGKRFNALKYVNLFYRYKNISEGNENGEFLGL